MSTNSVFLWRNKEGDFVSIAAQVRSSWNTASISRVYTPPKHRGKGYASCTTAMLSQKIIDEQNKTCNLFADVSNPISNHVYKKLGYKKVSETKTVRLHKTS